MYPVFPGLSAPLILPEVVARSAPLAAPFWITFSSLSEQPLPCQQSRQWAWMSPLTLRPRTHDTSESGPSLCQLQFGFWKQSKQLSSSPSASGTMWVLHNTVVQTLWGDIAAQWTPSGPGRVEECECEPSALIKTTFAQLWFLSPQDYFDLAPSPGFVLDSRRCACDWELNGESGWKTSSR